jgi:tRNA (uracil-5-)-methyltransferase
MVDQVVHYASLPSSKDKKQMTHLIDCYCGSGLFALSAASKFRIVVGIEVNARAVEEATQNAYENQIKNCHFRSASAEYIFADIGHYPKETSVVVLDPPRKGCSDDFLHQLYTFAPYRIVYMSCDPQTQARDAQGILNTGKYRILVVQPFDLFPQTRHIECLIVFERI